MPHSNSIIRNRKRGQVQDKRVLFVLNDDLLNQIRDVAEANHISVSHFLREAARRNIRAYEKAAQIR
jgi:hypothetical protein